MDKHRKEIGFADVLCHRSLEHGFPASYSGADGWSWHWPVRSIAGDRHPDCGRCAAAELDAVVLRGCRDRHERGAGADEGNGYPHETCVPVDEPAGDERVFPGA